MTSGTAALAMGIYLGKRRGYGTEKLAYRPHSVSHVILGTCLLWVRPPSLSSRTSTDDVPLFSSDGSDSTEAVLFRLDTALPRRPSSPTWLLPSEVSRIVLAAPSRSILTDGAGLTWLLIDYYYSRRWSAVSLCSGIVTGLIGITPAAGYVGAPASVAIGIITVFAANCQYLPPFSIDDSPELVLTPISAVATKLKHIFKFDDALDVFSTHAVGGFVGSLLTGIFADSRVTSFDTTVIPGGWINQNYRQLGLQLASATATISYTFVVTMIILVAIDHIPGLALRASEEAEIIGIDEDQCGETGYDYAYVNRSVPSLPSLSRFS